MFELLLWISQNFRYILGPDKFPFVFWVFQFLYHTIQASSFFFGLHLESFYFGEVEFLGILFIFIYLFIYLFFWWGRVILESFFLEGDSWNLYLDEPSCLRNACETRQVLRFKVNTSRQALQFKANTMSG